MFIKSFLSLNLFSIQFWIKNLIKLTHAPSELQIIISSPLPHDLEDILHLRASFIL